MKFLPSISLLVCGLVCASAFQLQPVSVHWKPRQTSRSYPRAPIVPLRRNNLANIHQSAGRRQTGTELQLASGLLTAVEAIWQLNPVVAGAAVCGLQASAADIIAQKLQFRQQRAEKQTAADKSTAAATKKGLNWRRTFGFLVYGVLYQGLASEFIYNRLYPMIFGAKTDVVTIVQKVVFDMFFQSTIVTLPVAYWSKSMALGKTFRQAMLHYVDDVKNNGLLKKYWGLWGPVQGATFGFVPEHLRITFIASISFFWVIILSSLSSRSKSGESKAADEGPNNAFAQSGLATAT